MLNGYTVPGLFVDRTQKRTCYLCQNTYQRYLLCCFLVSKYVLPAILTWKCINHTYLLALYTLSTPSTRYFFVYGRWKSNIYLSWCPLAFETPAVPFFLLRNLWIICCFFASKYTICVVFLRFNLKLHQRHLSCCILTSRNIICNFFLAFWPLFIFFIAYFDVCKR